MSDGPEFIGNFYSTNICLLKMVRRKPPMPSKKSSTSNLSTPPEFLPVPNAPSEKDFLKNATAVWRQANPDREKPKRGRRSSQEQIFELCEKYYDRTKSKKSSVGKLIDKVTESLGKQEISLSPDTIKRHVREWMMKELTWQEMPLTWKHRWLLEGKHLENMLTIYHDQYDHDGWLYKLLREDFSIAASKKKAISPFAPLLENFKYLNEDKASVKPAKKKANPFSELLDLIKKDPSQKNKVCKIILMRFGQT